MSPTIFKQARWKGRDGVRYPRQQPLGLWLSQVKDDSSSYRGPLALDPLGFRSRGCFIDPALESVSKWKPLSGSSPLSAMGYRFFFFLLSNMRRWDRALLGGVDHRLVKWPERRGLAGGLEFGMIAWPLGDAGGDMSRGESWRWSPSWRLVSPS